MSSRRLVQMTLEGDIQDRTGTLYWQDGSMVTVAPSGLILINWHAIRPGAGIRATSGKGYTCGHCHKRIIDEEMGKHISKCDPTWQETALKRRIQRESAMLVLEEMIAEMDYGDDES